MIYAPITKALETHLGTMVGVPPIARQNVRYTPTTDTAFVKSENIPTLRRVRTAGPTPWQRYEGLYRITACTAEGVGVGANYDLVDNLLTHFDTTTDLSDVNTTAILFTQAGLDLLLQTGDPILLNRTIYLTIDYSEAGTSYIDSPWFCTPVNIHYYAYWRNS